MLTLDPDSDCPCGSGQAYANCCGPLHAGGRPAATAEALMRSRYSAFVTHDEAYLLRSWHSTTRPGRVFEKHEVHPDWLGLTIHHCHAGGETDQDGEVEFIARFRVQGKPGQLHERSQFAREQGEWRYLDGGPCKGTPVQRDKHGRNDPCPCGSGKKYKKCCGL